jgi:hypothetical protein
MTIKTRVARLEAATGGVPPENLSTAQSLIRLARTATEAPEEQCCFIKALAARWYFEDGSEAVRLLNECGFEFEMGELERIRAHPSFATLEKLLQQPRPPSLDQTHAWLAAIIDRAIEAGSASRPSSAVGSHNGLLTPKK